MVVAVLMMRCHCSEKPKSGPLKAHTATKRTARTKVAGLEKRPEMDRAKRANRSPKDGPSRDVTQHFFAMRRKAAAACAIGGTDKY